MFAATNGRPFAGIANPMRDRGLLPGDNTSGEAIRAWLGARARAAHTARAYRKEAERLLLWSTVLRGKPMSSLDAQDCAAYRAFLAAEVDRVLAATGSMVKKTGVESQGVIPFLKIANDVTISINRSGR